ncbi:methylation-associated defense system restriction endonuclease subunit S MAD5 [Streptomyces iranensis]|uniref:Type I restriction enzyme S subunit n=1 Tax=Streptomyces iranensis TaxID=576784 RepID=A0A060ZLD5_9ACTN|nr:hypothetical protein [Streptomyces iranensis]MBP2064055.1 type I restriction enzyme S subunit [Streptomyces iranensis]CDR06539.1 predicted protein [Streptomyces iranensis]
MKVASLSNPVMSDWLADQGLRLDASPYISGSLEAKKMLERLPNTVPLASLTTGHNGGIFSGPMFRRVYLTDPEHSVPFLGTKDMMTADLTGLPRLRKSDATSATLSYLQVKPGMTLISRSGFNAGRRAYARPDMGDCWASEDILKVEPDPEKIKSGYLYAFLLSQFGESLVRGSVYGSAVKHIEPHHIAGLPVPRFDARLEERVHRLVERSAKLRARHQAELVAATKDFFDSNGLSDLNESRWHQKERDLGFAVENVSPVSLRASNYGRRAREIKSAFAEVPHRMLGEICDSGKLGRGLRTVRVETKEGNGVRLIGQRQAFWNRPEGRWVKDPGDPGIFATDETIMVTAQGLISENGLFGRSIFVTGSWLNYAYTEHFLRIVSGESDVSGAYLFAFFRSEVAYRLVRSMLAGTGPQSVLPSLLRQLPIPLASPADRARIAATVRYAYQCRDRADILEDKALGLLTTAIKEAAG